MVGVKGERKAEFAAEDDSGHENAQVKQPVQQHQGTAKRKMLNLYEYSTHCEIEASCHDNHM